MEVNILQSRTKKITGMMQGESVHSPNEQQHIQAHNNQQQITIYPKNVMESVRVRLGVDKQSTEKDNHIKTMRQVDVMDTYLESFGEIVNGHEVRKAVQAVFNIDLDYISKNNYGNKLASYDSAVMETLRTSKKLTNAEIMELPKMKVMDAYIKAHNYALTGAEHRVLINQIFGVNLDGISGVAGLQLGIFSKNIWIINTPTDMLVIASSHDDVELYVYTTDYWKQVTGTNEVPDSLKQYLLDNEFAYDEATDKYIWVNPTGESASEAFKSQTIGILLQTISQVNTNL
jgi:hypothetical protein